MANRKYPEKLFESTMIRFLFMITFFCILVLGIDYYVQKIASPVTYTPGVIPLKPEKPSTAKKKKPKPGTTPIVEEESEPIPILTCSLKKSEIEFYDYDMTKQKITFEICDSVLQNSIKYRTHLSTSSVSKEYVKFDSKYIEPIVDSYKRKIKELKLNKVKAAEYIVASIQSIPYTLVHDHSHTEAENPQTYIKNGSPRKQANRYAKMLKKIHRKIGPLTPLEQPGGCLPYVDYGIVMPVEMFINKMGDCDSRCTALFLVLKKLGYDVIELGSDLHQHAVLGLNLPGANSGNIYYPYKGRKYYIWETTTFHPQQTRLGVHSDGVKYMSNWGAWEVSLK